MISASSVRAITLSTTLFVRARRIIWPTSVPAPVEKKIENKWHRWHPALRRLLSGERSCLRLFQASGSLGRSAARAALAGHTRLGFDIGPHG